MNYKTILLKDIKLNEVQSYLNAAIAPRPVCFASTVDAKGNVNLSPFSYFNCFSINPPVIIFSPSRKVRDNTTKHTYENLLIVPEVVVNIVTYYMVQQVSLSSCEFPYGTDEFIKAGFTKIPSKIIRPPRVKESPVQMECKVIEIKPLGTAAGAGNLIIAEVILLHINESILNKEGNIDQQQLDLVARLGNNWYARVNSDNLFEVEKPNVLTGIGIDNLPDSVKNSKVLTGNDLGRLANVHEYPVIDPSFEDEKLQNIFQYYSLNPEEMENELHIYAASLLYEGKMYEAWQVLLALA